MFSLETGRTPVLLATSFLKSLSNLLLRVSLRESLRFCVNKCLYNSDFSQKIREFFSGNKYSGKVFYRHRFHRSEVFFLQFWVLVQLAIEETFIFLPIKRSVWASKIQKYFEIEVDSFAICFHPIHRMLQRSIGMLFPLTLFSLR